MKYILQILAFFTWLAAPAQTIITESKDTVTITTKTVTTTVKVPVLTYKDSTVTSRTVDVITRPYKPVTPPPIPPDSGNSDNSTTITFAVPIIPYSEADLIAPGRGAEQWHNGSATVGGLPQPLDVYYRFAWNKLEGATQGSYTWTYFDNLVKDAINKGQKLSFGIMSHRSDNGDGFITYDGARAGYPQYLHKLMQAEAVKDYVVSGVWVPNWNSTHYIGRMRALHQAIVDRLKTTTYRPTSGPNAGKTVLFKDAIYCIDIRGFGNWGEWHTGEIGSFNGLKVKPTAQTLISIINAHTEIFDEWPLSMMIAAFDGGTGSTDLFPPYPEVAYHALTARNKWGAIGYRRDQWGATDGYLNRLMKGNTVSYNGVKLANLIVNKHKEAPVTGEPMPASNDMSQLMQQINDYRPTSIGDGNYGNKPAGTVATRIKDGFKKCGYRLQIKEGSITTGAKGSIKVTWENVGIAPTYENWITVYELKSGNTVVWTGESQFKAKLFGPGTATVIDNFNIPTGNYTLVVKLVDPSGYRAPLVLANRGRAADGSYTLKP